ncbi:MAG TPA: GtrA family protein [Streptosporangiaceae bacterium]|nr:GtrA family protein [Streptosporangiaceae bacterium]
MKITIALYDRFRNLIHEVAKFGVVGVVGFIVTWGGTDLLHFGLHWGPLTSNIVATTVAATLAFVGNRYWTFRHRASSGLSREYFLFFVLNGVGLLIQLLCIGFTHYTLKLEDRFSYNVALLVGIALGTLFRYWSYKKWVFLPPQLPGIDARTGLPSPDDVTAPDSLRGTFADSLRGARINGLSVPTRKRHVQRPPCSSDRVSDSGLSRDDLSRDSDSGRDSDLGRDKDANPRR